MSSMVDRKNEEKLSLEVIREEKRRLMESLFQRKQAIEKEMGDLERELERLDNDIDHIEREIGQTAPKENAASVMHFPTTPLDDDDDDEPRIQTARNPPHEITNTASHRVVTAEPQKKPPPSASLSTRDNHEENRPFVAAVAAAATLPQRTGTLDHFFGVAPPYPPAAAAPPAAASLRRTAATAHTNQATAPADPHQHLKGDNFPWSQQLAHHLANTFRIRSFRDNQKEIIHSTMSGEDVFVIMRTGGGKSLTYQMPALLEGRGQSRKVSFVISPLLSLIQDQEEQMNDFAPGSAISFTSGLQGGNAEHARRWDRVRDPDQGVCIVFITPEKVSKSNKLLHEMEKLFAQGRLGRFVIDECHCACQWGHDFRPDYAQLGKLKSHFPSIPCIAVTATASDRVREDVCRILRLGTNYRFFRSTANRPNLHYSIRLKPDGKDTVVSEMAAFIKEKHANSAGIVYTLSKKDADTVADKLCEFGVVAQAYHSDVSPTKKNVIHRSWMRNDTQVVVATIAFGLGINKPDVRFVLHHSISKTLEAYYQESGRAGRDGKDADCVLYYSPKDTPRMLKLVHGTSSEALLWPMVRYAQQSGNDAVCRNIIMTHLGEPNCLPLDEVMRQNEGITTEKRDVGAHAKTVVQLLHLKMQQDENMTLSMLVKEWRAKPANAPPCVANNPPAKDGLTVEECERIIVALLLEGVLSPNPHWGAYDTVVYLILGRNGPRLLQSHDPKVVVRLPIKSAAAGAQAKAPPAAKKPAKSNAKMTTKRKKATKAAKKPAAKKKAKPAAKSKSASVATAQAAEVIELLSDDEENDDDYDDGDDGECEFE